MRDMRFGGAITITHDPAKRAKGQVVIAAEDLEWKERRRRCEEIQEDMAEANFLGISYREYCETYKR